MGKVTDQPCTGVRPSPGAAISELPRLSDSSHAIQMSYIAAPVLAASYTHLVKRK